MTIAAIAIATKMVTCKKKKKKSGGGPPDLSGAGSRDGCPRLKVFQVPKKNAPMNVCDLRIRFDRYVY